MENKKMTLNELNIKSFVTLTDAKQTFGGKEIIPAPDYTDGAECFPTKITCVLTEFPCEC